jgi:RNA polymerase sigma-70 factor (ECF subfamily)
LASWGDRLANLFAAHRARLEAFVGRRTGDADIAADLTQEAFIRLARLPDVEKVKNPAGFLFTIAANLARDHNRRATRWQRLDGGVAGDTHPSQEPDAEAVVGAREEAALLKAAIGALPDKARAMFVLFHVDGLSYREIAARTGATERSVEYHLCRSLEQCRAYVRRETGGRIREK